jgi:hypothetical protein
MSKKTLLFLLLSTLSLNSFSQKVDLDRFTFNVAFQILPQEPIPYEERTFGIKTFCGGIIRSNYLDESGLYGKIYISAWKKVENTPKVGVDIRLEDFLLRDSRIKTKTSETKDKDGKVISRTTTYSVEALYEGIGKYTILGPISPKPPTKAELNAQKKKEEANATNRFLANVTTSSVNETNGLSGTLNESYVFSTAEFSTSKEAETDYALKKDDFLQKNLRFFVDNSISRINSTLNSLYGFQPTSNREFLWILNSKSHPEYTVQQEAIQAINILFKEMKADQAIDDLIANIAPLIDYLHSLKTKYASDSKADKKMRYSAFYNLSKIYYFLDQPEKSIVEAEGLINNDYDGDDGETLIKNAEALLSNLKQAKVTTRHNPSLN